MSYRLCLPSYTGVILSPLRAGVLKARNLSCRLRSVLRIVAIAVYRWTLRRSLSHVTLQRHAKHEPMEIASGDMTSYDATRAVDDWPTAYRQGRYRVLSAIPSRSRT